MITLNGQGLSRNREGGSLIFERTRLGGVYAIDAELQEDRRGFFAGTWCQKEFEDHGLNPRLVQCNISFNLRKGTLRGMHYQEAPFEEAKLVRCTMGAICDVVVDLRPDSPTFREYLAMTLSPETGKWLTIPENSAHGSITLKDKTEAFTQISGSTSQ